jgi:hypothetical protein
MPRRERMHVAIGDLHTRHARRRLHDHGLLWPQVPAPTMPGSSLREDYLARDHCRQEKKLDICQSASHRHLTVAATRRRPLRIALAAILPGLSVIAGLVATPKAAASTAQIQCGVERWKVRTLQDRPSLLTTKSVTIAYLTSQPKPSPLPGNRAPFERHVFKVTAQVTQVINEGDSDLHLVLDDGNDHMIAEAPNSACTSGRPRRGGIRWRRRGRRDRLFEGGNHGRRVLRLPPAPASARISRRAVSCTEG